MFILLLLLSIPIFISFKQQWIAMFRATALYSLLPLKESSVLSR